MIGKRRYGEPLVEGGATALYGREIKVGDVLYESGLPYFAESVCNNLLGKQMIRGVDAEGNYRTMTVECWSWERQENGEAPQQYEGDSTMTEQNQTPDVKLQRTLFPQPHQLVIGKITGGSYLGSLWIGLTMPIFNLPLMFWHHVLLPAGGGLLFIAKSFIVSWISGLLGRAHGFLVDMPKRGE